MFTYVSGFISHTKLTVLMVIMDQNAQIIVPVIQRNVSLMDTPTVKLVSSCDFLSKIYCMNVLVVK